MRVMMKVSVDTKAGNVAIEQGTLPTLLLGFIERTEPEAAFFVAEQGKRTAYFVFDLASSADIPVLAEPFFVELGASVELTPAMNVEDMRAGVQKAIEAVRRAA